MFRNADGEIRAGWKIAFVFIVYFLSSTIIIPILWSALYGMPNATFITTIIDEALMIFAVFLGLKLLDKDRVSEIGLRPISKHLKDLGFGLLLGAFLMTVIFFVLVLTGIITLSRPLSDPSISLSLAYGIPLFIMVAIAEELLFRGYVIHAFDQHKRKRMSMVFSAIIFAAAHGLNDNVQWIALINIFLVGILLAYMYVKSNNLWMPIGFHITWNFFQGNIYGFPVSGYPSNGLYQVVDLNHPLLTGGAFGPEGGLLVTVILLIAFPIAKLYMNRLSSDERIARMRP